MPIFFGWGRQTVLNIGVVFKNVCTHCHNEDYWVLTKITTWFTLFFVPIVPYDTKYFLSCPVCKYGLTLNSKQVQELRPVAETNQLLLDGKITQEEHQTRMQQLHNEPSDPVQAEVIETKTLVANETNLNYCSNCGTSLTKELKFCGDCGTAVVPG